MKINPYEYFFYLKAFFTNSSASLPLNALSTIERISSIPDYFIITYKPNKL